jgi:putative DNA primase/helicase
MEVLPADCVESGFIWEVIGYAMYSGNPLHVAVLFHGKGRNGKGTLIRLLKALVGQHNCSAVGLHELVENRFRAATLYGKLANLAGDLDARWVGNTAMFKAITGGDLIQGEFKYGAAFDFTPWALPIYSANKAFGSSDSSEGWWSRWVVVPFPNVFTGTENRQLDTWLQTDAELRGVMRKGIAALPALMARGRFVEPESMNEAKETFIAASDAVRAWIAEQCTLESDAWEPRTKLYDAYAYRWQTAPDGSKTLSAREFYNRVEQIGGIVPATRKGIRGYKGIRLGAEAASQPAPGPRVKNGRSEP